MNSSSCQFRIYYEDTDAGGIVYYANYLKFAERARTEMLRQCAINQSALRESAQLIFVVRRVEADYLAPAYLDDLLTVNTSLTHMGGASFSLLQEVWREETLLASLVVLTVCVDSSTMKPARVPDDVRQALGVLSL